MLPYGACFHLNDILLFHFVITKKLASFDLETEKKHAENAVQR